MSGMLWRGVTIVVGSAVLAGPGAVLGTPDGKVETDEKILGSNAEGFVVLRTERDNLASYFEYRTKRFLDRYSKLEGSEDAQVGREVARLVERKVLLDVTTSADASAPQPWAEGSVSEVVNAKDGGVGIADILHEFAAEPQRWSDERVERLKVHPQGGVRMGRYSLIRYPQLKGVFGIDPLADFEWSLDGVVEDMNCLYLQVSSQGRQRWVCLRPAETDQVQAHATLKPFYISAGEFGSLDEAMAEAKRLKVVASENSYSFRPEIWSFQNGYLKTRFVVVEPDSDRRIEGDGFRKMEAALGVDLTVLSSERFRERTRVE